MRRDRRFVPGETLVASTGPSIRVGGEGIRWVVTTNVCLSGVSCKHAMLTDRERLGHRGVPKPDLQSGMVLNVQSGHGKH